MDHVLVVEDEASLRNDLVDFLSAKGYVTTQAATVRETRSLLDKGQFDAVILDIGLPDGDGYDILAEIRCRNLTCRVMMLTAYGEADSRVRGLEEGADAYLVKKATLREIDATLRSILRHRPHLADAAAPLFVTGWSLDRVDWRITAPNGSSAKLSSNEVAFFTALAECNGIACPRERIVQAIGRTGSPSDSARNLDAVVRRLRRKIAEATTMEPPIKMVYGTGYLLTAAIRMIGG